MGSQSYILFARSGVTILVPTCNYIEEWPKELAREFSRAGASVRLHARYSTLKWAYVTVMTRMPDELWPGLEEDAEPVTALAHLT